MLLVLSLMRNEHPRILLQLASCVRGQDHPAQHVNSKGNGLAHFVYVHLLSEVMLTRRQLPEGCSLL